MTGLRTPRTPYAAAPRCWSPGWSPPCCRSVDRTRRRRPPRRRARARPTTTPPAASPAATTRQPPSTTITSVAPAPNATGFTRSTIGARSPSAARTPATTTPAPSPSSASSTTPPTRAHGTWAAVRQPRGPTPGSQEYTTTPYTFRVRAVDLTDRGHRRVRRQRPRPPPEPGRAPTTTTRRRSVTFKVDTHRAQHVHRPASRSTTSARTGRWCSTASPSRWGSTATRRRRFACTLNGKAVTPCDAGQVDPPQPRPRQQRPSWPRAVDRGRQPRPDAGHDEVLRPRQHQEEQGLGRGRRRQGRPGYFGNDYLDGQEGRRRPW